MTQLKHLRPPRKSEVEHAMTTRTITVEALAAALIESGLMTRLTDYGLRAHPLTMKREPMKDLAIGWARDIFAALAAGGGGAVSKSDKSGLCDWTSGFACLLIKGHAGNHEGFVRLPAEPAGVGPYLHPFEPGDLPKFCRHCGRREGYREHAATPVAEGEG